MVFKEHSLEIHKNKDKMSSPPKMTMTAMKMKREFFLDCLRGTIYLATYKIRRYITRQVSELSGSGESKLISTENISNSEILLKVRKAVSQVKKHAKMFERFKDTMLTKFPDLEIVIEQLAIWTVNVMRLHDIIKTCENGKYINDPIRRLFDYLVFQFHMKPILILEDNEFSEHFYCLRTMLNEFIPHVLISVERCVRMVEIKEESKGKEEKEPSELKEGKEKEEQQDEKEEGNNIVVQKVKRVRFSKK